ncbi:MAG TPA: ATP-binding cassette domain-containing protein [Candidatus Binataceae bacterium]|nr:ATP-binding cassette domain-containing protein [Candidatus Binataceae bacterium]
MAEQTTMSNGRPVHIRVRNLTIAFGSYVLMRDVNFDVGHGDIFVIMGGSGCGKSTLLRTMVGLKEPARGEIIYGDFNFTNATEERREAFLRRCGISYQGGALWSSMTLAENVALPLAEFTSYSAEEIRRQVGLKLALVGLRGFEDYYPSQISGGMQKRAALARAMALDPEILFFDEPSAGLDPISSYRLDRLILELRDSLQATVMIVTHELPSIFNIASNGIMLDAESRTMIAQGDPKVLAATSKDPKVIEFLSRGQERADKHA